MFKKQEILRFETELSEELENVRRIAEIIKVRMDNLPSSSDGAYEVYIDSISHNIENFYMAVEEILKMICVATEEGLPEGERWHSILLKNMSRDVRNLRPPVISVKTYDLLDDFRKFRHLARNIYTFNIKPEKVLSLAKKLDTAFKCLKRDIKGFLHFLFKMTD